MSLHAKRPTVGYCFRIAAIFAAVLFLVAVLVYLFWPTTPPQVQSGNSSLSDETTTAGVSTSSTATTGTNDASATTTKTTTKNTTTTTVTTTTTTTTTAVTTTTTTKPTDPPIQTDQEMRGVWVSYIELNGLLKDKTPSQARTVIDGIMDNARSYGLNTVFLHMRANSDAYYNSSLFKAAEVVEPLLDQGFDPLAYAVQSAHSRGLALHAWINPYRVGRDSAYLIETVPYFVDKTGTYPIYYYIPSEPAAQQLILDGIAELLKYGVDGIHFDDYFYPTTDVLSATPASFEKDRYNAYQQSGGNKSIQDWRREKVDQLVQKSYRLAHEYGKIFGIAPSSKVEAAYSKQYADLEKWLSQKGYVDYLCPQIYYGLVHDNRPFDQILQQWVDLPRHADVKLYVGIAVYKVGIYPDPNAGISGGDWQSDTDLLYKQLRMCRTLNADGVILYSYTYLSASSYRQLETVWFNGQQIKQTYDKEVAKKALQKFLEELKNGG